MSHWKRCIQLGGNRKWVVWWTKHRFGLFELIIPNGLSKIMQRICNLVFHILWELRIKVLKNYEDKAKRPLLTFFFMSLIFPISMQCSLPKGLQEHSLTQIRILCSLWNGTNCIKLGENQQGIVCEAKHKPCMFGIIIPS